MTTNLDPMNRAEQMTTESNVTTEKLHEVLAEILERGDAEALSHALHIPKQHVHEWLADVRRNPLEAAALIVETLRKLGNEQADDLFLALARRLGFVAYRMVDVALDDAGFAAMLREFSDVIDRRAEMERTGRATATDRLEMAREVSELIERASAYRAAQIARAGEERRPVPIRSAVERKEESR